MQLLHVRNTLRTTFASKCQTLKLENNWNMKISFHYFFCFQRRYNVNFASFECAQLTLQFDITMSLIICWNALLQLRCIARTQYNTSDTRFRYSFRDVEHSSLKTIETDVNFISQYLLHLTSIQRNFCIVEMRQANFTIWCNYIIILCWDAWCAAIAQSHYIIDIVLKFLKMRFESLATSFFENWVFQLIRTNSNRLSLVIATYSVI